MNDKHAFSRLVVRSWLKIGSVGLSCSIGAWLIGRLSEGSVRLSRDPWAIGLHVFAASLRGFGIGFSIFFALMLAAASLYFLFHGRRR